MCPVGCLTLDPQVGGIGRLATAPFTLLPFETRLERLSRTRAVIVRQPRAKQMGQQDGVHGMRRMERPEAAAHARQR